MSYKSVKLGDIATFKYGKTIRKSEIQETGKYPVFSGYQVVGFLDGYMFEDEQLIIVCRGAGGTGDIKISPNHCSITNLAIIINANEDIVLKEYLYWVLRLADTYSLRTGSAQPQITINTLETFSVEISDDKDEQQQIIDILGNLNKKIQLNTETNQTLEAIAQALFKSWFIDFDPVRAKAEALANGKTKTQATIEAMKILSGKTSDQLTQLAQDNPKDYQQLQTTAEAFPSGFDDTGVPLGWEYQKADSLFDIAIGKTPPRKQKEWFSFDKNDFQWISIKDMGNSGAFIFDSSECLTFEAIDKFNVKKIPKNTVILSFKLTVGRVSITTCETSTNEAIAHFKLNAEKSSLSTEFLYSYLKLFDFDSLGSSSSIATAVNSKTIKAMDILKPDNNILKAYQYVILPIFEQIKNNQMQSNSLQEARDELLPKLLNGEI